MKTQAELFRIYREVVNTPMIVPDQDHPIYPAGVSSAAPCFYAKGWNAE